MWKTNVKCLQTVRMYTMIFTKLKLSKRFSKQDGYTGENLFFICTKRWKTSNLSADRIKKFCLQSSILLQCSRCGQYDHKLHLQGMKVGHHESYPVYPPKTVSEPCPQKGHLISSIFQISQPPTLPLPCSSHPTVSVFFWELFSIVSLFREIYWGVGFFVLTINLFPLYPKSTTELLAEVLNLRT